MVYLLNRIQQLDCDLVTAWDFFSSPHNLSRITPKEMQFTVLSDLPDEKMYEGMIIDYKISPLLCVSMRWQTRITQVEEGKSFTDFQQIGPYKLWNHFHEFTPNKNGVLMKDTVKYELPLGLLGDIAHSLIVQKKVNHIFDYRYQELEKLFNSKKGGI